MPLIAAEKSHLLLIDFQARLMPAIHEGEAVLANALRLGQAARLLDVPILRTEQYPAGLGPTVEPLQGFGSVIEKVTFSSCGAQAFATAPFREQLVVAGCETHVCVLQTVLDLLAVGRSVFVVADAVGSRAPLSRQIGLERMARAGAEIVTTEMVVFEWLGSSKHPKFREISRLIK